MVGKVLLVDGEGDFVGRLAARLERTGLEVRISTSGAHALEVANSWPAAVIVLNVDLPDMDGIDLCQRLRDANRRLGILACADHQAAMDAVLAYEAGADDFYAKTTDIAVAEAMIRRALRRIEDCLDCNHCVDLPRDSQVRALRGGASTDLPTVDPRDLTRLEERLLRAFCRAQCELVPIDALVHELWGRIDVEPRAIYEHISTLRAKLQGLGWTIVNVRGQGYRLARDQRRTIAPSEAPPSIPWAGTGSQRNK